MFWDDFGFRYKEIYGFLNMFEKFGNCEKIGFWCD